MARRMQHAGDMSTAAPAPDWRLRDDRPPAPALGDPRIPEGLATAGTQWTPRHAHPRGSWWQYVNDRQMGARVILGLGVMAVIGALLIVWVALAA